MGSYESPELIKARQEALNRYQELKEYLNKAQSDGVNFQSVAQQANEAWLEFKRADIAVANYSTLKKIGDLYGG